MTEFDGISQLSNVDQITIDALECTKLTNMPKGQKMKDFLEQKASLAIEPYVLSILKENIDQNSKNPNIEEINSILQKITSEIPAQTTCYFRAGKAYLRVNHEMGDIGNLFFKALLNNILKDFGDPHIQTQENSTCAICRI
jgi:hypothetical protein